MRLIDADKLIELVKLQQQDALDGANITNKTIFKQKVVDCKNFIELIQEMPTAFDLEAVVKKFEEEKLRYFLTMANTGDVRMDFIYEEVGNAIDKAIEIVKGGAV